MATGRQLIDWLRQVRQGGNEEARRHLLEAVRPEIRAFLEKRLRSHPATEQVAAELTQDVLIRISESLTDCRAQSAGAFRAWRKTIARRVWIDHLRRRDEEMARRDESVPAEAIRLGMIGTARDQPARIPSKVDRLIGKLLLEAQQVLSDGTARVIRRKFLYGDTWEEAGAVIGTSAGGAQRRWQRAKKRLRDELEKRVNELPAESRARVRQRIGKATP